MSSKNKPLILLILLSLFFSNCSEDITPIEKEEELPEVTFSTGQIWTSGFEVQWSAEKGVLSLEVSQDDQFANIIFETITSDIIITIEDLFSDTPYYVRYKLILGAVEGEWSEPLLVQTLELGLIQNAAAATVIGDEIKLRWDRIRGAEYEVQISQESSFEPLLDNIDSVKTGKNEFLFEPLMPLTTYYIRLRSINKSDQSDWVILDGITTTDELFFTLLSSDFENTHTIPEKFSCPGTSPELHWKNSPEETVSFAIIMEDLNNNFIHWILFNIPENTSKIEGGTTPEGSVGGTNGQNTTTYFGPCPPAGQSHIYSFRLYALDEQLSLGEEVQIDEFRTTIESKIIAQTELKGRYE